MAGNGHATGSVTRHDAVIVGGGPAGLSAARTLCRSGIDDVVVIERELHLGGTPRHCHHRGFGTRRFAWTQTGPEYASRLARESRGVTTRTGTTVVELRPDGELVVASGSGLERLQGRAVLLATGVRETPRAARLVSGARPWGVLTTGTLQQLLAPGAAPPWRHPVIVGTEWVSFSTLFTLKRVGLRAVAMLEARPQLSVPSAGGWIVRALFRVPVLTGTNLQRIVGRERVEAVELETGSRRHTLACDSVVFTGCFVPEASLVRNSHLEFDYGSAGPVIDQHWRCSDPAYFAAGNLLRSVETAGVCAREGETAAASMMRSLAGQLAPPELRIRVRLEGPVRFVHPQIVALPGGRPGLTLHGRAARGARGTLRLLVNGVETWHRSLHALPDRRLSLPVENVVTDGLRNLQVRFDESARETR